VVIAQEADGPATLIFFDRKAARQVARMILAAADNVVASDIPGVQPYPQMKV
jgi:hypothetical protein